MMNNFPLISVLVPVYNVERYLRECLDSILSQTLKDIEIIVVDDGSTDSSGAICDEYAEKDSRVSVIHKSRNEGLLLARKTAVLKAKGTYTVFVDSDDLLSSTESLQVMYDTIVSEQIDILQFTIELLHPDESRSTEEVGWHKVYPEKLEGSLNIIKACIDDEYNWCLWNKIYRTSVCKQAYEAVKNVYVVTAEDCYGYFLIAFHADTFKGIKTAPLYAYRQGSGVTTKKALQLNRFEMFCRENLIVGWIRDFLSTQEMADGECSAYKEILKKLSKRFLDHCLWRYDQLSQEERKAAQGEIFGYFPPSDVFEIFHEKLVQLNISQEKQRKENSRFRQDIAKRQQVERDLRQEIVSDKERFKIIKDFNIGRYLRTKMLSKISLGKTRQRLKEQYQHQKYCYRLIKNGKG